MLNFVFNPSGRKKRQPPEAMPLVKPCQWPMWPHKQRAGRNPQFCCAATVHGHSYCAEHCDTAYGMTWRHPNRVGYRGAISGSWTT